MSTAAEQAEASGLLNQFDPYSYFGAAQEGEAAVAWNIFPEHRGGGGAPDLAPDLGGLSLGPDLGGPELGPSYSTDLASSGLADSLLNNAQDLKGDDLAAHGGFAAHRATLEDSLDDSLAVPGALALNTASITSAMLGADGMPGQYIKGDDLVGSQSLGQQPAQTQQLAPTQSRYSGGQSSSGSRHESGGRESGRSRSAQSGTDEGAFLKEDSQVVNRPELTEEMVVELNDISQFRKDDRFARFIVPYQDKVSFPLGEGGRELLRACLNVKGCKGRQLQGASVPVLLQLAYQWDLWDVALRIKVERQTGQLSPAHEAFVRFKATQSQLRKYVRKEYMVTERDPTGKISRILYDENRKIKLGKDGREALRAKLRRLHDKHATRMDELLAKHGFKYSELRNATVQQLSRMAFVCNLWDQVVSACRSQEEKRDGKGSVKKRLEGDVSPSEGGSSSGQHQVRLPFNLLNGETIMTDENGEMSNDDARRTMEAVSQLLQQSFGTGPHNDIFNAATFTEALTSSGFTQVSDLGSNDFGSAHAFANEFASAPNHYHASAHAPDNLEEPALLLRDVKQEPCDQSGNVALHNAPYSMEFNPATGGFF
ncbi:hypothetical protein GNI_013380 [Gregarina niphandrodes]|uniref:Uncharacterized protein n=1 Tax=Gregarina niphandrodes TaxID=110365 RepID=A0A023BCP7_GRENI|nr:hypothetical protein GNI_013380 [Gregarina niphandrodes]EZG84063.1 hypothetical protein GNI_013380 [Gregarina niphandrodes]|eukprot:XP_011128881.1 hypothetical protein GNI_013380 [Gregarina niphandrodes]